MKKRIILTITLILLLAFGLSAYSKSTTISENTLLYVQDHAGENFMVLKVEACSLGNNGEIHCSMEPQVQSQALKAGPQDSFFARLAYPG